jgi:hypothetical protein
MCFGLFVACNARDNRCFAVLPLALTYDEPYDFLVADGMLPMMAEDRRRAYLRAMQVDVWLPRIELPFAAPSRPELLNFTEPTNAPEPEALTAAEPVKPAARVETAVTKLAQLERPRVSPLKAPISAPEPEVTPEPVKREPPPRFSLQLLRAGCCLLLVDVPASASLAGRDPAYALLRNMLHAAGLPDSPQLLGEPIRWPLLANAALDQGPEEARVFVQSVVASQLEVETCDCLWLVGRAAARFVSNDDIQIECQEVRLDSLGSAWIIPGLEALLEQPRLKADVWRAMQRISPRWIDVR